jgi:hypothetical protein
MAGSIALSMTQQLDRFGKPLAGGKLFFIQAGTVSTPQNAFQDSALTLPWPNPMILDASGRIGQLFFADGSIKIRLIDVSGAEQLVADGILVVGASSGGGGGSPVDPTTVFQTGALMPFYGTGVRSGFVRANARTIGSATSGATERANSDCQALFEYLWGADANLTVSTGRGASANADWTANKTLALPDWRGRALAGLDDMGNSAAGRLTSAYFGGSAIVLGATGQSNESNTLLTSNLPAYTPAGSIAVVNGAINITNQNQILMSGSGSGVGGGGSFGIPASTNPLGAGQATTTASFSGSAQGGTSAPFRTVPPMMLATIFIKL